MSVDHRSTRGAQRRSRREPLLAVALSAVFLALAALSSVHGESRALPIFDTHVHYSQDAWKTYSADKIIGVMKRLDVARAAVSSSPDEGTRMLYKADPDRIVPILRPYHDQVNSGNWYATATVIPYLISRLETPIYQGIGEFHLHSEAEANTPVVRQTVQLALERGLYLHVHSNAEAVRAIFKYAPKARILWAHSGMTEPPEVVTKMLDEYENLWTDTSYREYAIAPNGKLDPTWRALLVKHADRITIGTDTWITSRWSDYEQLIRLARNWLNQLPRDVAEKIAYRNAVRLFGAGSDKRLAAGAADEKP
jgi:hypothetical protein